tara:strand:+ start:612 stop:806 length:195 start_codon:yes stop_codon:yes gene_type:complete
MTSNFTPVDLPNLQKHAKITIRHNMPDGTGKRHLAKSLKKSLKRRKNIWRTNEYKYRRLSNQSK